MIVVIDLQGLSDDYWDSTKHEVTVLSQSDDRLVRSCLTKWAENVVIGRDHVSLELQFSANATVRHPTTNYLSQLTMSP